MAALSGHGPFCSLVVFFSGSISTLSHSGEGNDLAVQGAQSRAELVGSFRGDDGSMMLLIECL